MEVYVISEINTNGFVSNNRPNDIIWNLSYKSFDSAISKINEESKLNFTTSQPMIPKSDRMDFIPGVCTELEDKKQWMVKDSHQDTTTVITKTTLI